MGLSRAVNGRKANSIHMVKGFDLVEKIKIMTDSACDIDAELEKELNIKILCFPITVGEKSFFEREDMTTPEFYDLIEHSEDMPKTAQVTAPRFEEAYKEIFDEGYTDLIYISIASKGSNTNASAHMAMETFYGENPDAKDKMKIHIVDSKNYTGVYGHAVIHAAKKAEKGASVEEILSYLDDWFACAEAHFCCYSLKYAKKSGRISCAAAFLGEMLGLRPIIRMTDAVSTTEAKVRGDKGVIPKLVEIAADRMIPQTPYSIMYGESMERAEELADALTKKVGYAPDFYFQVGAAVASNSGPNMVGLIIKAQR